MKDTDVEEVSPHAHEDGLTPEPVPPLFQLDCQPPEFTDSDWRAVVVCHECFHRLEPDMWISPGCWASLSPKVPFENLPPLNDLDVRHDVASYPDLLA